MDPVLVSTLTTCSGVKMRLDEVNGTGIAASDRDGVFIRSTNCKASITASNKPSTNIPYIRQYLEYVYIENTITSRHS